MKLHFRWRWKCKRESTVALVLHWTTRDSSFFRPGAHLEQRRDRSKLANAGQENVSFPAKEDRTQIERPQKAVHVYAVLFCFWQNVSSADDRDCQSTASIRSKWRTKDMSYKINRFHYNHSANAWVTKLIFEKWLKELSELLTSENPNEHFVLLADHFAGHSVNCPSNITLKFMPRILLLEPSL